MPNAEIWIQIFLVYVELFLSTDNEKRKPLLRFWRVRFEHDSSFIDRVKLRAIVKHSRLASSCLALSNFSSETSVSPSRKILRWWKSWRESRTNLSFDLHRSIDTPRLCHGMCLRYRARFDRNALILSDTARHAACEEVRSAIGISFFSLFLFLSRGHRSHEHTYTRARAQRGRRAWMKT